MDDLEIQIALGLPDALRKFRSDPSVRKALAEYAGIAGDMAGLVRGAYRAAKAPLDAVRYVSALSVPGDPYGARRNTAGAIAGAAEYAVDRTLHPEHIKADLKKGMAQTRRALLPSGSPQQSSLGPELNRRFNIGMNQGELAFDAGAFAVGGPLATSEIFEPAADLVSAEKFLGQGYEDATANYLSLPYVGGMGSHFIPRRFAKFLPEGYIDSPFNLIKPKLQSRGNFYEFHARVDDRFHAARTPNQVPETWTAKRSGVERPPLVIRLWDGMPIPLKLRLGGLGAVAGDLGEVYLGGETP